jgi:hypothetical protein
MPDEVGERPAQGGRSRFLEEVEKCIFIILLFFN